MSQPDLRSTQSDSFSLVRHSQDIYPKFSDRKDFGRRSHVFRVSSGAVGLSSITRHVLAMIDVELPHSWKMNPTMDDTTLPIVSNIFVKHTTPDVGSMARGVSVSGRM